MSPIVPINLGAQVGDTTCPDRRVTSFDDTGLCGDRLAKVAFHRTAHPCRKDCIEMGFASCAAKTLIEDCLCQDASTTAPGYHIDGGFIGFSAPVGQSLTDIALLSAPGGGILGTAGAYWFLFAANDTTDLNCPIDEDDWDAILINGAGFQQDLTPSPLTFDDEGNCTGGAITVPLGDLNLTDAEGLPCVQTGGRRAFAVGVYDAAGNRLMFCPVPGILPPPRCDRIPCCNWSFFNIESSEGGDLVTITVTITRPDDCTCTPNSVIVTIDGTALPPGDPSATSITFPPYFITPIVPGYVVVIQLDQTYGDCDAPECVTLHDETTVTLT